MLNFALLEQPFNWIIIFLMLILWAFAFDMFHAYSSNRHPADAAG